MMDILHRLKRLDKDINLALIGVGSAGKGIFYQSLITPGISCRAVADIKIEKAIECMNFFNQNYAVVENLHDLNEAVSRGRVAVCQDGLLLAQSAKTDVLIDASTAMEKAAQFAVTAIEHKKHIIMMNAEADLIFGPYFLELAQRHGVVYTSCDGDQPTVIKRIVDEIRLWGFELVMAGNIKGFLDRYANPTTIIPEADKRGLDYKMCTSYTDGTKICIEMALVANALGLRTTVPGMLGPRAKDLHDVFHLFDFKSLWQDRRPVVDYVIGPRPKGGIFVIGYSDNAYQKSMVDWFPPELGPGPFYIFYRPYHLVHIESLRTVAEAYLEGYSLLAPEHGFRTNVYAYAKKDLHRGEKLDGLGGYACYGLIENCTPEERRAGLPICLAEDAVLKRNIVKDEKIFMDDLSYDPCRFDFKVFSLAQEASKRKQQSLAQHHDDTPAGS